jgi:hypothetical protein
LRLISGSYDSKLLEHGYQKPLEWQYREGYPYEDNISNMTEVTSDGWENVDNNYTNPIANNAKAPEDFVREVEEQRQEYNAESPNMWDNRK